MLLFEGFAEQVTDLPQTAAVQLCHYWGLMSVCPPAELFVSAFWRTCCEGLAEQKTYLPQTAAYQLYHYWGLSPPAELFVSLLFEGLTEQVTELPQTATVQLYHYWVLSPPAELFVLLLFEGLTKQVDNSLWIDVRYLCHCWDFIILRVVCIAILWRMTWIIGFTTSCQ